VDGSCEIGISPCTGHEPAEGKETDSESGNGFCGCGESDARIEVVSVGRVAEKEKEEARCEGDTWPSGIDNAALYTPTESCILVSVVLIKETKCDTSKFLLPAPMMLSN